MIKPLKVLLALLLISTYAFAQENVDIREAAKNACHLEAAELSGQLKESTLRACLCTAENTDYQQLTVDSLAGNLEKLQADASRVAEICAE